MIISTFAKIMFVVLKGAYQLIFFFIYLNRIRKEFLDAEAELSGSEGSDDEDERGLDKLLVEEGDLDDIDIDEVRYFFIQYFFAREMNFIF